MRRADRLYQIVNVLRRRRTATTATHLAGRLGVSERTVYRDIRDLVLAGTPIDGEAGVGYRIRSGYDLPPLMFDRDEIQALVLGARIVRQFGDPALARASDRILGKVSSIVPADLAPLAYLARFVTPPASPIRFAACFFLCPVPAGQAPRLVREEASEAFWVDPVHAYARFRAREWPMAEPAEYTMRYLAQFDSYAALWAHHAAGRPAFHGIIDRLDAARHYRFDWDTVVRRG